MIIFKKNLLVIILLYCLSAETFAAINKDLRNAIWKNNKLAVKDLIAKGININATDWEGFTALMKAADLGRTEIVDILIHNGAKYDARYKTKDGNTYLISFARAGLNDYISELLNQGADINWENQDNETALDAASKYGNVETVQLLLSKGADPDAGKEKGRGTAIHYAITSKQSEITKLLIEGGADINAKDAHGNTPLKKAAVLNQPDIARLLISKGAWFDISYICAFASAGMNEYIKELIDKGADIEYNDSPDDYIPFSGDRYTPLMHALKSRHILTAELLIENGADVNKRDVYGKTVLTQAAELRNADAVKFLTELKTATFSKNGELANAVKIAEKNNDKEILSALQQKEKNIYETIMLIILALVIVPGIIVWFVCSRLEMDRTGSLAYVILTISVILIILFFPHAGLGISVFGLLVVIMGLPYSANIQKVMETYISADWSAIKIGFILLIAGAVCFGIGAWLSKVLTGDTVLTEFIFSINIAKPKEGSAYYWIGALISLSLCGANTWLFLQRKK